MSDILIRNLQYHEMKILDQIAEIDRRNPGLNDGEFLFRADDKAFIAAIMGSEVIGTVSSINYQNNLGFIGNHYVVPHLQGNGLTEKLLSVAMDVAGKNNIGINCREEQVEVYEKAGFKTAFKIINYEGKSDGIFNMHPSLKSPLQLPFDELYNYYRKNFPYERKVFINLWVNQPGSLLLGKYEDNEYKGYGLFKPCRKGYRLSPLISDDAQSAHEILTGLSSHFQAGTPYYLDIPEPNSDGINLASELKLKKTGEMIRMYYGKEHEISLKNIYSFTSLEIG